MQLVENDEAQVLEELHPLGVMGKDPGVEHVGVRDDDMTGAADRGAHGGRGVAVVRVRLELDVYVLSEPLELAELILGERLRREDVERARGRVLRDRVDDRQVVAQRLAARGRGDDDGVLAGVRGLERVGLVRVKREDAPASQRRRDPAVQPSRELRVARATRRDALPARDHLLELGIAPECVEDLLEADSCGKSNGRSHDQGTIWNGCSDVKMMPQPRLLVR